MCKTAERNISQSVNDKKSFLNTPAASATDAVNAANMGNTRECSKLNTDLTHILARNNTKCKAN